VVGTPAWAAPAIAEALAARGVETRDWWGAGCHSLPAFAGCPRAPLPVTDRLARSTLGLPYFIDLEEHACRRIIEALADALETTHG
jgi:dTDP-4-amino-4,6-dideoxygalactose transaminase